MSASISGATPAAFVPPALPRAALADSPVIITVAPNGAYKKAADHPAVPLTADALAAEARACLDAGAAMMHMHVRKPDGSHLLDAQAYRDAIAAVQRAVGDGPLQRGTDVVGLRPAAVPGGLRPFVALGDLRLRSRGERLRHDCSGLWRSYASRV